MGGRADPIAGVDVILTKPDGSTETQTTEDDGKFSFKVTEPGDYLVGVDPDTLPKGSELGRRPAALEVRRRPQGRQRRARQDRTPRPSTVRAADFDDATSKIDESSSQRQRAPARAAAGPGPRRPVA